MGGGDGGAVELAELDEWMSKLVRESGWVG